MHDLLWCHYAFESVRPGPVRSHLLPELLARVSERKGTRGLLRYWCQVHVGRLQHESWPQRFWAPTATLVGRDILEVGVQIIHRRQQANQMVPRSGLWAMLREKHLLSHHRAALWVRWLILFPLWQREPQAGRLRNRYAMGREKHRREFKCAVDHGQHEALSELQKVDREKLRVQPHDLRHLQAFVLLDMPGGMGRSWVDIGRLLQVQQIWRASKGR